MPSSQQRIYFSLLCCVFRWVPDPIVGVCYRMPSCFATLLIESGALTFLRPWSRLVPLRPPKAPQTSFFTEVGWILG